MSVLAPKIHKLIQQEKERIVREQVTPWIMGFASGKLVIENFYKRKISYEGGSYEGSPRDVFWNRYIEPFLEDTTDRLIAVIKQECIENNLNVAEELNALSGNLKSLYARIYEEMARIDQRMLGKGFPERIAKRDTVRELADMSYYLDQYIQMEIVRQKSKDAIKKLEKKFLKQLWHDPVWSKVIAASIAAIILGVWKILSNQLSVWHQ